MPENSTNVSSGTLAHDKLRSVKPRYRRVTDDEGQFLFEIDLNRLLIITVRRGKKTVVDLAEMLAEADR